MQLGGFYYTAGGTCHGVFLPDPSDAAATDTAKTWLRIQADVSKLDFDTAHNLKAMLVAKPGGWQVASTSTVFYRRRSGAGRGRGGS